jgi:hypothetical protein
MLIILWLIKNAIFPLDTKPVASCYAHDWSRKHISRDSRGENLTRLALFFYSNVISLCTCGIAIRSHDSLFVVRTCDVISTELYVSGRHYPSMKYSVCDNKHMVIETITGTQYKVSNATHSDCLSCTGSIHSNCINWKMFHIIRSLFKI